MATNTTNFNLKKPAYTDTADIEDINGNMDKVDVSLNGLADAIAIVANNNTHAAITAGQYVYVHGHGTLAEGLYTANSNISANATLSSGNLTANSAGGLNALNSKIANIDSTVVYSPEYCLALKKAGIAFVYGHSAGGLVLTGNGSWQTLTTLPVGYRPSTEIYFAGATANGKGISFHINTSGLVEYVLDSNSSYWNYGVSFIIGG